MLPPPESPSVVVLEFKGCFTRTPGFGPVDILLHDKYSGTMSNEEGRKTSNTRKHSQDSALSNPGFFQNTNYLLKTHRTSKKILYISS